MINSTTSGAGAVSAHHHHHGGNNDFKALGQALQSGDTASAQKALASIQKNIPANAPQSVKDSFTALSQALSTGDVKSAQTTFASIEASFKAHRPQPSTFAAAPASKQNDGDGDDGPPTQALSVSA